MNTYSFNAVIIDDDDHSRQLTARLLQESFPAIAITGQAATVAGAVQLLAGVMPDIIFMDVELPDGSCFDILRHYPSLPAEVILVTAFDHYALRAIKASVIDYLLKPLNEQEFTEAVQKAIRRCRDKDRPANDFSELLNRFHNQLTIRKITIPTLNGFMLADIDDIIRCEASDNYTVLHFTNGNPRVISRTLGKYEEELREYGFVRIHHKYLINVRQVMEYNKGKSGGGYVVMKDKAVLEVSVRKKELLLQAFQNNRQHS